MKLLVDTNVLIDIRKSKGDKEAQERYAKILYAHDIYVPGVVEAELLHGAVSEKNQRELHKSLDVFAGANQLTSMNGRGQGTSLCQKSGGLDSQKSLESR